MTAPTITAEWASTPVAPAPGPREWDAYLSRHGRSFWMAARMIPQPYRAQLAGVYAYCRYTNDLVDAANSSRVDLLGVLDTMGGALARRL